MREESIPQCFGTYEAGNPLCDGPTGDQRRKELRGQACAIRLGCEKVLNACHEYGCTPQEWIQRAPKDLPRIVERGGKKFQPVIFIPEDKFKKALRNPEVMGSIRRQRAMALVQHFETLMRDAFPRRRFEVALDRTEKPLLFNGGTFYVENHLNYGRDVKSYLSWFCTDLTSINKMVAQLWPHVRKGVMSVRLPFRLDLLQAELKKVDFDKLQASAYREGTLRTLCRDLGLEGVGLVVSIIERFDREGLHPLPERT